MASNRFLSTMNIQQAMSIGSTAAARDSDWVSLANYASVIVIVNAEAGASGDDVTIGVHQATSNTGSNEKNLSPRQYYRKQATTIDVSGSYDDPDSSTAGDSIIEGSNMNMLIFEIGADEMDVSNGFEFIQITVDNGGSVGKILGAYYVLCGARYAVEPTEWPAVDA